jgi:TM2 domain-containing membrane protein YozV
MKKIIYLGLACGLLIATSPNASAVIAINHNTEVTASTPATSTVTENSATVTPATKNAEAPKQNDNKIKSGGGKSQLIAALLAFFLGAIGIHRFYLGYTTIGIIQLLTLGGFGIWAFIDFIRILVGDLKPKDGDYTDKF